MKRERVALYMVVAIGLAAIIYILSWIIKLLGCLMIFISETCNVPL